MKPETNENAARDKGQKRSHIHRASGERVVSGPWALFRNGKKVKTHGSYESALAELEAADGQGWSINASPAAADELSYIFETEFTEYAGGTYQHRCANLAEGERRYHHALTVISSGAYDNQKNLRAIRLLEIDGETATMLRGRNLCADRAERERLSAELEKERADSAKLAEYYDASGSACDRLRESNAALLAERDELREALRLVSIECGGAIIERDAMRVSNAALLAALERLGAAAARIVEDDALPTMEHMRELDRCRADASQAIAEAKGGAL